MSGTDPDAALVRDLYADDSERRRRALAELYERHHRRVYTVAYRTLGRADLAEDVTQEVFLQLSDHAATWRGESGFLSWLYRVTLNRAIDERRREKRHPAFPMTEDSDAGARRPRGDAPETDPSSGPDRDALAERVQAALAELPPRLRAIAVLRYGEGLSYDEISEIASLSLGTVKSRLHRAHLHLVARLGPPPTPGAPSPRPPGGPPAPPPGTPPPRREPAPPPAPEDDRPSAPG